MTIYRTPSGRPYQRQFRVLAGSAIAVLLAIILFAIYEKQNVSRSTDVALAFLMGAIAVVVLVYGFVLFGKDTLWQFKQSFQWEIAGDKILQNRTNGETVEISLNHITTLREFNGWLVVAGGESQKRMMISQNVDGYDEIRRQLTAHCPLTPGPKSNRLAAILPVLPVVVFATLLGFVIVSHVPAVVIGSGLEIGRASCRERV